jgi:excisionase family DNA binding protein
MQQEILLVGIKPDELLAKIEAIIEAKLSETSGLRKEDPSTKYLSRAQVAELLKISLPTLHSWTKIQLLQSYKIGNRVLYKQEEVEKALVQTTSIKYKKNRLW